MLNSDEFYAIKCVLNYAWAKAEYDRYLATENGIPCVTYIDHKDYPNNVTKFTSEEAAITAIKDILNMPISDTWSTHDRLNFFMIKNSNKYHIATCKIEDNRIIETVKSTNIAELDRRW